MCHSWLAGSLFPGLGPHSCKKTKSPVRYGRDLSFQKVPRPTLHKTPPLELAAASEAWSLRDTMPCGCWEVKKVLCTRSKAQAAVVTGALGRDSPSEAVLQDRLGSSGFCLPSSGPTAGFVTYWRQVIPDPVPGVLLATSPAFIGSALMGKCQLLGVQLWGWGRKQLQTQLSRAGLRANEPRSLLGFLPPLHCSAPLLRPSPSTKATGHCQSF